jgi:hypothetical protein
MQRHPVTEVFNQRHVSFLSVFARDNATGQALSASKVELPGAAVCCITFKQALAGKCPLLQSKSVSQFTHGIFLFVLLIELYVSIKHSAWSF